MNTTAAELERESGTKMVITIHEHALATMEEFHNGASMGAASYSHEEVAIALLHSLETNANRTPILPRNAIFYSESTSRRFVLLEIPPQRRDVYYHQMTAKARIKNVPFPRLIVGFELHVRAEKMQIAEMFVAALEDQEIPNEDSKLYNYPYTNVNDFVVCFGGQQLPEIERVSQLATIPELFFNSPNSDCYYSNANNSKKPYRELVEELKGKSFPDEYLKPAGVTLQEWIRNMSSSI
ncbi:hypothetical protein GZH47_32320 (plasmid) [Paenibacillus rhizovicinus]|uniref:Uncharacterized protein n=1 Tax=Paenibacillus rhizovicinus TaxID=2704463 RepID=A0A6C0PCX0_9BACL|nr:hypothetical protein [Paenibacillus rhizovicinus]QHW35572.1 hypothetical protein GZH47_32320 [Paenibacillus rhizovicinus]